MEGLVCDHQSEGLFASVQLDTVERRAKIGQTRALDTSARMEPRAYLLTKPFQCAASALLDSPENSARLM